MTRDLATALPGVGWGVTLISASVRGGDPQRDARTFYRGIDVHPLDVTAAVHAADPMRADPPVPPLFQERDGPRLVFAELDDAAFEHQVNACARVLIDAHAADADVLHLHHLTPLNEAAARVAPHVPVVGHLHGTEMLFLEEMERRAGEWPHAPDWIARMRRWASDCAQIILVAMSQLDRAERLLGVAPARCVTVPNGFDPAVFNPSVIDRAALWRRHLVDSPRGWLPGGASGSISYTSHDLDAFAPGNPVLINVGRFAAVKRLGLLIEAYGRARTRFSRRAPLVLLGGFPGEYEGEHPIDAARRLGVPDVFLAGWHPQDQLPSFMAAADVVVLPSIREQFGLALVEAMACGLPAIAANALGPAEIVRDGETGWLVRPDDLHSLTDALVEAVNDPAERRRRGASARADVHMRFTSQPIAAQVAAVYDAVTDGHRGDDASIAYLWTPSTSGSRS